MLPYRIHVILGFHVNFYHSWRGDAPDETGFGTDMRIVRHILKTLDQANAAGLKARGYWDTEVYYTIENILPRHAPDILASLKRRNRLGLDEILPGPYNNGANHAATAEELRTSIRMAMRNPSGSGLEQVFDHVTPIYRSQEMMLTPGHNAMLLDEGMTGVILYYAGVPFNSLSAFIPTLPIEQRFNPLLLRLQEGEPPIPLLPAISMPDLIEFTSLEAMLLRLHRLQESGQVKHDLAIHLNMDADDDAWLHTGLPRWLDWFPNSGGLEEYIRVVNRYPWATFSTPGEYLASHPPLGEVLVRQDLADGGFDGNYSWAEKYSSLVTWSLVEQSRLSAWRAVQLARRMPREQAARLKRPLLEGQDSAFFLRMCGLSTTHFGMSTPVINEERQVKADEMLGRARQIAVDAEARAARSLAAAAPPAEGLYVFEVYNYPRDEQPAPQGAAIVRLDLWLPQLGTPRLVDEHGEIIPAALLDPQPHPGSGFRAELFFQISLAADERRRLSLSIDPSGQALVHPDKLSGSGLELALDEDNGLAGFTLDGQSLGSGRFLQPFITYRTRFGPRTFRPKGFERLPLIDDLGSGVQRARLQSHIHLPGQEQPSQFTYTFSLPDGLPLALLDVEAHFSATPKTAVINTILQRLRRRTDLRWVEVAPCAITTALTATEDQPLRVWKHNPLGITSYYDLDYGQINPANRQLDSFNHQVTAGWVALSDRRRGLLVGESAEGGLTSMAFCPMRLRLEKKRQRVMLNPFGSFFGRQLSHSHLGGTGVGETLTSALSGALRPNGPSYNGQTLHLRLLLAPYEGDQPPAGLQSLAQAWFYPPGVVLLRTPAKLPVRPATPAELTTWLVESARLARQADTAPLPAPQSLLANPAPGAAHLVWDAPQDERLERYQLEYQLKGAEDWQTLSLPPGVRHVVEGLEDGKTYLFRLKAIAPFAKSDWTETVTCQPGSVPTRPFFTLLGRLPPGALLRLVYQSLKFAITKK